jgi:hypothetical protein
MGGLQKQITILGRFDTYKGGSIGLRSPEIFFGVFFFVDLFTWDFLKNGPLFTTYIYIYIYIYIYNIYIYISSVCVCVCVCVYIYILYK